MSRAYWPHELTRSCEWAGSCNSPRHAGPRSASQSVASLSRARGLRQMRSWASIGQYLVGILIGGVWTIFRTSKTCFRGRLVHKKFHVLHRKSDKGRSAAPRLQDSSYHSQGTHSRATVKRENHCGDFFRHVQSLSGSVLSVCLRTPLQRNVFIHRLIEERKESVLHWR